MTTDFSEYSFLKKFIIFLEQKFLHYLLSTIICKHMFIIWFFFFLRQISTLRETKKHFAVFSGEIAWIRLAMRDNPTIMYNIDSYKYQQSLV